MAASDDPIQLFSGDVAADDLLFEPPGPGEENASITDASLYRLKAEPGNTPFYIEIPSLSVGEKEQYAMLHELESGDEDEDSMVPEEIEGEYTKDSTLYYFARHRDGIVRRVCIFS